MTQIDHEARALNAYLQLLANKGADPSTLSRRRDFLMKLLPQLRQFASDGRQYREEVDRLLQQIDQSEWTFYINVACEYFHFWVDDIKAIAAMHARGGYEVAAVIRAVPEGTLKELWKNIDKERFSVAELWPLNAYAAALREEGADRGLVETRSKIVKLLLVRLRDVEEKDGKHYRVAIDSALPLFRMEQMRQFFLLVAREFFYFWINAPDAASHLMLENSGN